MTTDLMHLFIDSLSITWAKNDFNLFVIELYNIKIKFMYLFMVKLSIT